MAARIRVGRLTLRLPDGSVHAFSGGGEHGPHASLQIRTGAGLRRLVYGGDIGFAQSYVDGHCHTPDLRALMELAASNEGALSANLRGSAVARWLNRAYHRLRANSRRGSRRNIAFHYDLGNGFYRRWLDPGMSYSSAIFERPDQPLAEAQDLKYRRIGDLAGLQPGNSILEIGCGWGGFMEKAARSGCRVEGITLSKEQLAYANERMVSQGLQAQAAANLTDYRDTHGEYDAVVSIEMLEAVGEEHWPQYFQTLRERLKPGAAAVVQVITIAEERFDAYRGRTDFIQRYIFPGGMLPTPSILHRQAAAAGLVVDHQETFGSSYARTLEVWRRHFIDAWEDIAAEGFDERFRRLWEYYLCYCETGFSSGSIDVGIYRFRRPA